MPEPKPSTIYVVTVGMGECEVILAAYTESETAEAMTEKIEAVIIQGSGADPTSQVHAIPLNLLWDGPNGLLARLKIEWVYGDVSDHA